MPIAIRNEFDTADDAIAQLESEGFTKDFYDHEYPWRSRDGIVTCNVRYRVSLGKYVITGIA